MGNTCPQNCPCTHRGRAAGLAAGIIRHVIAQRIQLGAHNMKIGGRLASTAAREARPRGSERPLPRLDQPPTCPRVKNSSPTKIACAPTPPAPRQCTPPRLAHSLRRTRLRLHSAIRIHTQHMSCELLAATHMHNTLHCTYTSLHSAHNKRVMNFLDTANTIHAPRASSRFSYILRASPALFCTRILNRERAWQHLRSLLR